MRRALAVVAALFPLAAHAAAAEDWFRAYQYAARPQTLRGCSDCAGERDDVCEIPAGVLVQPIAEYAHARWPAPGRLKLLRSKADPDCAVPAAGPKGLFGGRGGVEIAAIRLARATPSIALVERFGEAAAVHGWPVAPSRRKPEQTVRAQAQRSSERLAVVCWPSEQGWPAEGRSDPGPANACEVWLLPVRPQTGDPDLAGMSFPATTAFPAGDPRWAKAFDPSVPLDDSLLLGNAVPGSSQAARPMEPAPPPSAVATVARCGEAARKKAATLERFEQWEAQVLGVAHTSLDRQAWTLESAAWSGHCQELDVLRAALEQQLGCTVARRGPCLLANGQAADAVPGTR
jgi:hypothetical protein